MDIISADMGIGDYLQNVVAIIFLRSVISVIIFSAGTYGCVEGVSRCLTNTGKALTDVHLTLIQGPAESVFDGCIGEFLNHEEET